MYIINCVIKNFFFQKTDKDFKICTECAQNVCPHSLLINVPEKGVSLVNFEFIYLNKRN